jgi:preprotein translocase subunit SecY
MKKLWVTVGILFIFCALSTLPVPFLNVGALQEVSFPDYLKIMNLFSGGGIAGYTVMAVGVLSFVTANIIMQILTYNISTFYLMQRTAYGKKQIEKATKYIACGLAFWFSLMTTKQMESTYHILSQNTVQVYLIIAVTHVLGTITTIYFATEITEKGIGDGLSLLLCTNIVSQIPGFIMEQYNFYSCGIKSLENITEFCISVVIILFIASILFSSNRKIQICSIRNGQKDEYPIRTVLPGVYSVFTVEGLLQSLYIVVLHVKGETAASFFAYGRPFYIFASTILVFIFNMLFTVMMFDSKYVAESLQKAFHEIPSVRPGKQTSAILNTEILKTGLFGSFGLMMCVLISNLIFVTLNYPVDVAAFVIVLQTAIAMYQQIHLEHCFSSIFDINYDYER